MANLLEIYDNMLLEEQKVDEQVIEKNAEDALVSDRIDILTKYATTADNMLAEEYGKDYTEEDVKELATYLIDNDAAVEAQQEKIAEYHQLGQIMAKSFKAELEASDIEEEKEEK